MLLIARTGRSGSPNNEVLTAQDMQKGSPLPVVGHPGERRCGTGNKIAVFSLYHNEQGPNPRCALLVHRKPFRSPRPILREH